MGFEFARPLIFLILPAILITGSFPARADSFCGQNTTTDSSLELAQQRPGTFNSVTIDYAVFYTPQARDTQGGTEAMHARIAAAFEGANQLFTASGASILHRVVHMEELPINNTSTTLPELNTELATAFDFFSVLDSVNADTSVIVVNFQIPGGYANIPLSPGQASRGASINLGLPNLSGGILAHEIGHTLGVGHDYTDSQSSFFYIPPTYNYGNHFIGATSGTCYRTIMSARTTCRIQGHEGMPAVLSNLFSNPLVSYEGTPTGDPVNADAVRMFTEFAPYLGSARGDSQLPAPTPTPDGEVGEGDSLTLRLSTIGDRTVARGQCRSSNGDPLEGDLIEILLIKSRQPSEQVLASPSCRASGNYRARFKKVGRMKAKNTRSHFKNTF